MDTDRFGYLVVGDIVRLQSGDKVPADVRLLSCRDLQVDESALTGESVPVIKKACLIRETILADRRNMAYAGTLVTYGQAQAVIVATGDNTETGRISELIAQATDLSTPLTKKIAAFSKILLIAILALAALTFAVGLLRGEGLVDMFMATVALTVGAIPEGLPAAVTITLAIGVGRMAEAAKPSSGKLPAVETLGSTTVICSDKTGTLTENQMTVRRIFAGDTFFDVEGNGYAPEGRIASSGAKITSWKMPVPLAETSTGGHSVQRFAPGRGGQPLACRGRPDGRRAASQRPRKAVSRRRRPNIRPPRLDVVPIRVGAPVHGDVAQNRRRQHAVSQRRN